MLFIRLSRSLLVFVAVVVAAPVVLAQTYTVLYSFSGGSDGALPVGGIVLDSGGNLYGVTHGNPVNPQSGTTAGSVFKLSPSGQFTLLHNFAKVGVGGGYPAAGLVLDSSGNLYGTAAGGGTNENGVVFEITYRGGFRVLYRFAGGKDGSAPVAPLILDPSGNLYGTTLGGGHPRCGSPNSPCGTVFRVDAKGSETVLYHFGSPATVGQNPYAGVISDGAGNLYGVASQMGLYEAGTVFKLGDNGQASVLYPFTYQFGQALSGLVRDGAGSLYGTTSSGNGAIYRIDPQGNETTLYTFNGASGAEPLFSGVIMDSAGSLYGTTYGGGNAGCTAVSDNGCGVVYKLDLSGTETVLYKFTGGADGGNPQSGVVRDGAGNLYGSASYGGTVNSVCPLGCGVVFKITP